MTLLITVQRCLKRLKASAPAGLVQLLNLALIKGFVGCIKPPHLKVDALIKVIRRDQRKLTRLKAWKALHQLIYASGVEGLERGLNLFEVLTGGEAPHRPCAKLRHRFIVNITWVLGRHKATHAILARLLKEEHKRGFTGGLSHRGNIRRDLIDVKEGLWGG